jgi:hypothetical protein
VSARFIVSARFTMSVRFGTSAWRGRPAWPPGLAAAAVGTASSARSGTPAVGSGRAADAARGPWPVGALAARFPHGVYPGTTGTPGALAGSL